MPILRISSMVTVLALSKSIILSGPSLLIGSRPIQKFRVTLISRDHRKVPR